MSTTRATWYQSVAPSESTGVISTLAFNSPSKAVTVVLETNLGDSVTPLNERVLRLASENPACVTTRARQFEQFHQVLVGGDTLENSAYEVQITSHHMVTI